MTGAVETKERWILAVGTQNGNIMIYDLATYSYIAVLVQTFTISKIKFLDNYPILCVADESGRVCIWDTKINVIENKETKPIFIIENSYVLEDFYKNITVKCMDF